MDFLEICAGFEKDIAYRETDEYKESEAQKKNMAELEKKRIELLRKRADEMEAEVNYMKLHPTAAWLKHFYNKWIRKEGPYAAERT